MTMMGLITGGMAGLPPLFATLDPASVTNITLSNGNLTGTTTSPGNSYCNATGSHASGKYYFEITINQLSGTQNWMPSFIAVAAVSYPTGWCENYATSAGIIVNGLAEGGGAASAVGDVIGFAIDLDNLRVWARDNGGIWNQSVSADPATNTLGIDFSAANVGGGFHVGLNFTSSSIVGDHVTCNFGATPYAFTPPTLFGNW